MEAKDTVMNDEQLEKVENDYLDEDFSVNSVRLGRGNTQELRMRIAQAQARISFKAGMKEVVEWVNTNFNWNPYPSFWYINDPVIGSWDAKLREWGFVL